MKRYVCLLFGACSLWLGSAGAQECSEATLPALGSKVTMFAWSDKYVYQPGESLALRWTVKTNGDEYPYTVVAFRQNNQTGARTYLPGGTAEATDIFGNSMATGFQATALQSGEKQPLLGEGGLLGGAATIPDELGMHTITVQLRDCSGTRVLKTAYMKIGVVDEFVEVSGNIESNRTWVSTKAYRVSGVVFVRNNAVLTIEPGTFVIGQPGSQPPSALIVTRSGRINAAGTRSRPIVMTSSQPFGQRRRGDWGGLVMLGRAPVNTGANIGTAQNPAGEFNIEGLPASEDTRFGGTDVNHNCGTLAYVRVEYAGSILSPNNELNSFTWGGCGKQTVAHHLQAIFGLDDAFEWFGGTNDARYLVGGLNADDFVDYQLGWTGRLQYGIFYQSPDDRGNRGVEGDNSEFNASATPLSKPVMYNLTFIGSGQAGFDEANSPGLYLRRGAGAEIYNTLVTNFASAGVLLDGAATTAQVDANNIKMDGILLWNNFRSTQAENTVQAQVHSSAANLATGQSPNGRNFVSVDPMLRRPFDYSDPDFRGAFGSRIFSPRWVSPPDDGFFDQTASFIGGMGETNWTE
ncbi:MAG: hypothetical protein SFV51_24205, partial [Bryobacteraceae bacterium]|nr:hypothetical protein [Bryobacteraceae bacterium]